MEILADEFIGLECELDFVVALDLSNKFAGPSICTVPELTVNFSVRGEVSSPAGSIGRALQLS